MIINKIIKEPIFILAGTVEEAKNFANEVELGWNEYIYLSNISKLKGNADCTIIMTKTAYNNKWVNWREIESYARLNNCIIIKL